MSTVALCSVFLALIYECFTHHIIINVINVLWTVSLTVWRIVSWMVSTSVVHNYSTYSLCSDHLRFKIKVWVHAYPLVCAFLWRRKNFHVWFLPRFLCVNPFWSIDASALCSHKMNSEPLLRNNNRNSVFVIVVIVFGFPIPFAIYYVYCLVLALHKWWAFNFCKIMFSIFYFWNRLHQGIW